MESQPFIGVILHAVGGFCSAVFYLPFLRIRGWSWETYWIVGGIFSWVLMPTALGLLIVDDLYKMILSADPSTLAWCYFFGVIWGIGGLMFGLTVRYLGVALGVSMALGYCAAFGTLMPPLISGELVGVISFLPGQIVLLGVGVCLAGIFLNGWAGWNRDKSFSLEEKRKVVKEFNFSKGVVIATLCGIFSASMSYGFAAGKPIADIAVKNGTLALWSNLPVLVVILWGGFTSNLVWCIYLSVRNQSYINFAGSWTETAGEQSKSQDEIRTVPMVSNLLFSAAAGSIWYMQFFFYGMGISKMGRYEFSSWTLHMASIIIFGTMVGIILKEWKGVALRTWVLVFAGLAVLISSTLIVGYGNYLGIKNLVP